MRFKHISVIFVIFALALAALACGSGDDEDDEAPTGVPTATQAEGNGADSNGESGDEPSGDVGGESGNGRGSGTVVIGDQTFDFVVDVCIIEDGGVHMGGASSTADGEPVYVEVAASDTTFANVDVGIGSTSLFDVERGDIHYETAGYSPDADFIPPYVTNPDLVVEINGGASVSFTTEFTPFDEDTLPGSVTASCE